MNKSGTQIRIDLETIRSIAERLDDKEFSQSTQWNIATRIAAMYLAGFCAECLSSHTDTDEIVGAQSHDVQKAVEVLELVGAPVESSMKKAWSYARRVLCLSGDSIFKAAALIPETNGTHQEPLFF